MLLALHTLLSAAFFAPPADGQPWFDLLDSTAHTSENITRETAERHILAYLTGFTRARRLPEGLTIDECENRCYRRIPTRGRHPFHLEHQDGEPCPAWTCTLAYGDVRGWGSRIRFKVMVNAGGRWISDDLGITRCLARRHGCRLHRPQPVERQLSRRFEWDARSTWSLLWDPRAGQFVWEHSNRNNWQTRRLAAHVGR